MSPGWIRYVVLGALLALTTQVPEATAHTGAATRSLADRVLVIRNEASPSSRKVADDYIERRGIKHVLKISCPDAAADANLETISIDAAYRSIVAPLLTYLKSHPDVDFIVLTKGIPIRIETPGPGITRYALDSHIAALGYGEDDKGRRANLTYFAPGWPSFAGQAWVNRYWNSNARFSHEQLGGYLVTRLDGYTAADAIALTTRALEAEKHLTTSGFDTTINRPILLDVAASQGADWDGPHLHIDVGPVTGPAPPLESKGDAPWKGLNSDMILASRSLAKRSIAVLLEGSEWFAGRQADLMGYVSFGSNDPRYRPESYRSLRFAPGALAETAVSTSARTFLPTIGGQSLIADLIRQGVTGVKGYSDEPLTTAIASPTILFDRYARGWTLAESYYAASAVVGWMDVVIGDPIARAYPHCDCQPLYALPAD